MAAFAKRWRPASLYCSRPLRIRSRPSNLPVYQSRSITSSTTLYEDPLTGPETRVSATDFASTLEPSDRADYDALSPKGQTEYQNDVERLRDHLKKPNVEARLNAVISNAAHAVETRAPRPIDPPERYVPGFMSMGEEDERDIGSDEEFKEDDISSLAHGELEQHREMREYARIAAWEMPLLSKFAKLFEPPALDQPLRFRYTTYMGEEHPAAKKVVLEFCPKDLPDLTDTQREKLIKLVGVRYNPQTEIVKMSSETFETQAQNKRYLGDLVDTLLREAQDSTDTFDDIPLDFRHHTFKTKLNFPDEWKRTPERRQYLEGLRQQRQLGDGQREQQGRLVDGTQEIERAYARIPIPAIASTDSLQRPGRGRDGDQGNLGQRR